MQLTLTLPDIVNECKSDLKMYFLTISDEPR